MTLSMALRAFLVLLLSTLSATAGPERRIADRVFLVPDPASSSVRFQMLVEAGCADEAGNICKGLAHWLEHLVLAGRSGQHADQALRFFADGTSNGWTSLRATGYVHSYPARVPDAAERLDHLFGFYAARLRDLPIAEAEAARERAVVRQEYDWRWGGNPYAPLWPSVTRFLYGEHPLSAPPIGNPEAIAGFTIEEATAFHRRWYRRSNVWFLVTGPLPEATVERIARRHLDTLPDEPPPARAWKKTLPPLTPDRLQLSHADPRISAQSISYWKAAPLSAGDPLRLQAQIALVNEYLHSRISGSPHSQIVEVDELAQSVSGARLDSGVDGLIQASLTLSPEAGLPMDVLQQAPARYFSELAGRGIDARTLGRLKQRLAIAFERAADDPQARASRLMEWLGAGRPIDRFDDYPEIIASITPEEIAETLHAVAAPGREVIATYNPGAKP
jgi:zinc protease